MSDTWRSLISDTCHCLIGKALRLFLQDTWHRLIGRNVLIFKMTHSAINWIAYVIAYTCRCVAYVIAYSRQRVIDFCMLFMLLF